MEFGQYCKKLASALKAGNATEHTHRPAFKELIETVAPGLIATNEPKRIQCGAPDFIVTRNSVPVGYIEAKDVGKDLDREAQGDQLTRYRASLRNLILTDYIHFLLYRNGELVQRACLAEVTAKGEVKLDAAGNNAVQALLERFFLSDLPSIATAQELAQRMAFLALLIRDLIQRTFSQEGSEGELHSQYEAFRVVLLADLEPPQFADMYAQTLCYGLFAARCNHVGNGFTREHAAAELPKTNPFLRKTFAQFAGVDLDDRIAWAVDDLADLLRHADMPAILKGFGIAGLQQDPVVHFYETFLSAYDPTLREKRGVYYTPAPVVSFIVRSIDTLLKTSFSLKAGLADSSKIKFKRAVKLKQDGAAKFETFETHRVQILDPATGTGTFLYEVMRLIRLHFSGNAGLWPSYVSSHLLPRLFGFELLMAPYAVAHMKLSLELKDSGYDFASDERLRVYLTNTLEEANELTGLPLFTQWLSQEAASAAGVKKDAPIMIILGNPPYSGHSANTGAWITGLLHGQSNQPGGDTSNYFEVDGKPLGERGGQKWLNDDYVKFMRFAQWRIEQTGHGIVGFVTNHGYLDNPTFRGMRQALMEVFDEIYVVDLHGNSKKTGKTPTGEKDENVFDIQQGVAVGIFVKRAGTISKSCKVCHAEVWGSRKAKYEWLAERDVSDVNWSQLSPNSPQYLFVPQDETLRAEYEAMYSVADIFNQAGEPAPGFVTTQDEFAISWTKADAVTKVEQLLSSPNEQAARKHYKLCSQDQWNYGRARSELADDLWRSELIPVLYRPYDTRWTVWNRNIVVHRRERVMSHLLRSNVVLLTTKTTKGEKFRHVLASRMPAEVISLSPKTSVNAFAFPLYYYSADDLVSASFGKEGSGKRIPNLSPEIIAACASALKLSFVSEGSGDLVSTFGPQDVFDYIYAVLFSEGYRIRYVTQLKSGFPRIPVTANRDTFLTLCKFGGQLLSAQLGECASPTVATFPVVGTNVVERIAFDADKIWINAHQYFGGVSAAVWEHHIGGYQVARKWLKDRKLRSLSHDDLVQYMKIVEIIKETLRLQQEIDAAIPAWPMQ